MNKQQRNKRDKMVRITEAREHQMSFWSHHWGESLVALPTELLKEITDYLMPYGFITQYSTNPEYSIAHSLAPEKERSEIEVYAGGCAEATFEPGASWGVRIIKERTYDGRVEWGIMSEDERLTYWGSCAGIGEIDVVKMLWSPSGTHTFIINDITSVKTMPYNTKLKIVLDAASSTTRRSDWRRAVKVRIEK